MGKNLVIQFKSQVILLIERRLQDKLGTYKTDDNTKLFAKNTFPLPTTQEKDPTAILIL